MLNRRVLGVENIVVRKGGFKYCCYYGELMFLIESMLMYKLR